MQPFINPQKFWGIYVEQGCWFLHSILSIEVVYVTEYFDPQSPHVRKYRSDYLCEYLRGRAQAEANSREHPGYPLPMEGKIWLIFWLDLLGCWSNCKHSSDLPCSMYSPVSMFYCSIISRAVWTLKIFHLDILKCSYRRYLVTAFRY